MGVNIIESLVLHLKIVLYSLEFLTFFSDFLF
jgi:hypothetical protein